MKIIAGKYKGQEIKTIAKNSTRPMMAQVRESIFNSLQFEIDNAKVLDLFAGSGSLGIESLSRGAVSVSFIEISKDVLKILKNNLINIEEETAVIGADVFKWIINCDTKYDIIFIDPPFEYKNEILSELLDETVDILEDNGKIILHRHSSSGRLNIVRKLELVKEKKFGPVLNLKLKQGSFYLMAIKCEDQDKIMMNLNIYHHQK